MQPAAPSNPLKKIFNVCLILMFLFFTVNLILGYSLKTLRSDIKGLQLFLANAENVKPNFEESLNLYTQGAKESIDYVDTLRPNTETEYIEFISSVEAIGLDLALSVDLESLSAEKVDAKMGKALRYRVEFFGGQSELISFLERLEALPYYIRVDEVRYAGLQLVKGSPRDLAPNIVLTLQLYVQ